MVKTRQLAMDVLQLADTMEAILRHLCGITFLQSGEDYPHLSRLQEISARLAENIADMEETP